MAGAFVLVALASVIAVAHGWPSAEDPLSEDERTELYNDLNQWESEQTEPPTDAQMRKFLQMKYIAMKQEQMNRLYTRLASEIGRPSKGLWRKKKYSLPTLAAEQQQSSGQSSHRPDNSHSGTVGSNDSPKPTTGHLPSLWQTVSKKNAADDDDQLMDIWKSGFRFKKSAA
uniref:Uncharacterized protein n=1 Tax=Plectus sambesii TaxID=2011161 RepID=A0A914VTB7_9BILA